MMFVLYERNTPMEKILASYLMIDVYLKLETFMKMMEQDVRERAERRKASEKIAVKLKDEGNELFKEGDYQKAVDKYVEVGKGL